LRIFGALDIDIVHITNAGCDSGLTTVKQSLIGGHD
jgi:hypothetical protein